MKLDVAFTPGEPAAADLTGRTVVVIDVLRATTSILEALASGARSVVPAASVEDAVRARSELAHADLLLCGERGSLPIPGFDLGNSPHEFTPSRVAGRTLLMTTTNGTRALLTGAAGAMCVVACLRNAAAVADTVAAAGDDAVLLCSGRHGRFAMEDAVCAGIIAQRVAGRVAGTRPNDATRVAVMLARRYGATLVRLLNRTAAGRHLARVGLSADIAFCAKRDIHSAVPRYHERRITL